MCLVLLKPEDGIRSPVLKLKLQLWAAMEQNPGPLWEQHVFLPPQAISVTPNQVYFEIDIFWKLPFWKPTFFFHASQLQNYPFCSGVTSHFFSLHSISFSVNVVYNHKSMSIWGLLWEETVETILLVFDSLHFDPDG